MERILIDVIVWLSGEFFVFTFHIDQNLGNFADVHLRAMARVLHMVVKHQFCNGVSESMDSILWCN